MTERLAISILVLGCVLFGAIIFLEAASSPAADEAAIVMPRRPARVLAAPAQQKGRLDKLVSVILARPLFSPTRRPETNPGKGADADVALANARLTGIVTREGLRLAIFAIPGKKPLALAVGDRVSGWRIDSIAPDAVALRGPTGVRNLAPKPNHALARRPLPAAFPTPVAARKAHPPFVVRRPPPRPFGRAIPLRHLPEPGRR